jgi:hypothetical protein
MKIDWRIGGRIPTGEGRSIMNIFLPLFCVANFRPNRRHQDITMFTLYTYWSGR